LLNDAEWSTGDEKSISAVKTDSRHGARTRLQRYLCALIRAWLDSGDCQHMVLMKTLNRITRPITHGGLIALVTLMIQGCGEWEQGVPAMNEQEQQTVDAYTRTQAPVCIGRFQVAMPQQLKLGFSSLTVNSARISAKLTTQQMFNRFVRERTVAVT